MWGADGLAFVKHLKTSEGKTFLQWDFYNNDGSHAEMCGNAARCVVVYCADYYKSKICSLKTVIGDVAGELSKNGSAVTWKLKNTQPDLKTISLKTGKKIDGYFIDTGVPHFVVPDEPSGSFSSEICLSIQEHEFFSPRQTNVTLLSRQNSGPHLTRSFERGVKNFTLACGTGVIASALTLKVLNGGNQHSLQAPGGLLNVQIQSENKVELEGPAKISFKGSYL